MTGTIERARGKWRQILTALGVAAKFLQNKHGPCPVCGGKDRFRFDDRNGERTYYCNQCGAGTGIILLRKLHGWTHKEACDAIDEVIGMEYRSTPTSGAPCASTAKLSATERMLAEANDREVVTRYLTERGLEVRSDVLLGHRACAYFDDNRQLVGRFPAVLAPILAADGTLVSAQRIWRESDIGPGRDRKKPMPVPFQGALNGAAVRLFECDEELAISEGVETALAVHEMYRLPVWAALSANGLKTFQPPSEVRRLHVFADCDQSFTGQAAAFELAERLGQKIDVIVNVPDVPGTDFLDVLTERTRA